MRALLLGMGLLTLSLGCYKVDVDVTEPGVDVDATEPGKVCEVHNIPLRTGVIPIGYGKPWIPPGETEARQKLFPHARSSYGGGCMIKDAKWARVSFCPECRKAEAKWKEEQARKEKVNGYNPLAR